MNTAKKTAVLPLLICLVLLTSSCGKSLVTGFKAFERFKAGLGGKSVLVDDHTIAYLEGGEGEPIILLHGFGADKDNWTRFAGFLTDNYRAIAPDLPGFGESSKSMDNKYDIETQVERVHRFAGALGLERFHIVGNSMGGYIAGMYAAAYPGQVLSLGLIAPAGVKSPAESEYNRLKKEGKNPLIAQNAAEYDELMSFVFVTPPEIPESVKSYLAEQAVKNRKMNEKIFIEIQDKYLLQDRLGKIQARTLILWGDTDRVLDVSGAPVFNRGIDNSELFIMENCGHLPMVEYPRESSEIYRGFLNRDQPAGGNKP